MNYRSVCDLNDAIARGFGRLPDDIDLVVGVPRSGLLAANLYALVANVAFVDLEGFLAGRILATGRSRPLRQDDDRHDDASPRRVLVIDDSVNSGAAMREARARIAAARIDLSRCTFCAVYGTDRHHPDVDIVLERVRRPRLFQWNLFHHKHLAHSCVDLEGVLQRTRPGGPGDRGRHVASSPPPAPFHVPSTVIGHVVTTRPERERVAIEAWLASHGIRYRALHMRADGAAPVTAPVTADGLAAYRAGVYGRTRAVLFVAAHPHEAATIAAASGKPVLCLQTQTVHTGRSPDPVAVARNLRNLPLRFKLASGGWRPWRDIVRANVAPRLVARVKRVTSLPRRTFGRVPAAAGQASRVVEEHRP